MENKAKEDSKNLVDFEKAYLENNVWPSIQICVKNRYLIILGMTGYYSYALSSLRIELFISLSTLVSVMLTILTSLNSENYESNAAEQKRILEKHSFVFVEPKKDINSRSTSILKFTIWLTFALLFSVKVYTQ